ncbi:MAG: diphthamide biosynthesis enzyme Dph2, partial [Candidatus Thermoplasmatota archaeon]|nr:diphthamide biosynthesis enzyme Dph2 [Candidatus Thermoplasmatota archaeon]
LYEQIEGKVALYGPVQHLHHLEKAAEELEERGIEPVIGEGDDRIKYPGQVLGCNYSVKVEDAVHHLYIGTGRFHPFGLSFSLRDDVKVYNPVTGELTEIGEEERDDFLRKRFGSITQVEGSERIMVMTSTKKGQRRMKLADEMRELGREAGKEIDVVKFDEIDPVLVDDFRWGCAVNTACPRIALDDNENFRTTILTPNEFKIALGEREWEDWEMDEIH